MGEGLDELEFDDEIQFGTRNNNATVEANSNHNEETESDSQPEVEEDEGLISEDSSDEDEEDNEIYYQRMEDQEARMVNNLSNRKRAATATAGPSATASVKPSNSGKKGKSQKEVTKGMVISKATMDKINQIHNALKKNSLVTQRDMGDQCQQERPRSESIQRKRSSSNERGKHHDDCTEQRKSKQVDKNEIQGSNSSSSEITIYKKAIKPAVQVSSSSEEPVDTSDEFMDFQEMKLKEKLNL